MKLFVIFQGDIRTQTSLDREEENLYILTVVAGDGGQQVTSCLVFLILILLAEIEI